METSVDTGTQFKLFSTAVVALCWFWLGQPVRLEESISRAPFLTLLSL